MTKIRPLADRIVVRREEKEKVTPGGLVIPESYAEKPPIGKVVAIGPGAYCENRNKRIPIEVKVGDTVTFGKMSPTEIKLGDETFWVMREKDIVGVIK